MDESKGSKKGMQIWEIRNIILVKAPKNTLLWNYGFFIIIILIERVASLKYKRIHSRVPFSHYFNFQHYSEKNKNIFNFF